MKDLFNDKNISPMLLNSAQPFSDNNYIFELKLDGIRCLAYLDSKQTTLRNKRNKDVTLIYPELSNIHKNAKAKCILDGELISTKGGKPNFFHVQKRSLMLNKLKIKLQAQLHPISFVAYDILYIKNEDVTKKTLMERKLLLRNNIKENNRLLISRFIEENGVKFFELAKQQNLEGIVAKDKNSKYYIGTRSSNWLKIKALVEEDLVICGYTIEDGKFKDLILGYYKNDELMYRGTVYLGVSKYVQKKLSSSKSVLPHFNIKGVKWIEPKLVGTVSYMHKTSSGGMRQPIFKGLRNDKAPRDCVL